MIYADLPASASIFLDANVLIHHFEPNARYGPPATEFLERIENQEIVGITTTHVVSEVTHRLMTLEAMQSFRLKPAGIAVWLHNDPSQVQTLHRFRQAIREIPLFAVRILPIEPSWRDLAAEVSQQTRREDKWQAGKAVGTPRPRRSHLLVWPGRL
jgi:predicted nucleic acid-binding protein